MACMCTKHSTGGAFTCACGTCTRSHYLSVPLREPADIKEPTLSPTEVLSGWDAAEIDGPPAQGVRQKAPSSGYVARRAYHVLALR